MYHQNLRTIRKSKNISAYEIAKLLEVSVQYVYMLERGEKPLNLLTAVKLADRYNVSLDELIGRKLTSE